ncbi:hypothetical protein WMY93_026370 [Mugilogobius chulae]|uniref:B30.2/SPRY domain-containing protein n=1 Tax=Mugilogobius chulae TaxID=88201 RepID=A0AAW0MYU9_9GOBI
MDWDGARVIGTEDNKHQRWIKEAIEIRKQAGLQRALSSFLYRKENGAKDCVNQPARHVTGTTSDASEDDCRQAVLHTGVWRNLPDNLERCTAFRGVLGKQRFSSGRFYFEVKVKGNHEWVVGVAKASIDRKRAANAAPANGYWILQLFRGHEYGTADPEYSPLTVRSRLRRLAVFVDYDEGLVCFYNAETTDLIYCFDRCGFTGELQPYFYTDTVEGKRSAPLVIAPVTRTAVDV